MNKITLTQKALIVIAVLVAYWVCFLLLKHSYITSSAFVTLIVAATVVSLTLAFAPYIQEVSIAGNIIKLREAKAEADKALEGLKHARVSMLVATLSSLRRSELRIEEQLKQEDDRIGQFLSLFDTNQDLLKSNSVAYEFRAGANEFMKVCLDKIYENFPMVFEEVAGLQFTPAILEERLISKYQHAISSSRELPLPFVEYRKLSGIIDRLGTIK
ncbi:hypothetical protein QWY20_08095 [Alkalimonas sp. MEB108]|uniref:LemA family protein n=1 Tax=Alkalimonas cellulosilytica TaxID=3058395 RepID=A0ABU7J4W0_9GAMM|nr:hypothetical protein [Alkalimonas sp. MEB108]MEE2001412.1 hypothetical protein [Alkalimonas sp. MEB108]